MMDANGAEEKLKDEAKAKEPDTRDGMVASVLGFYNVQEFLDSDPQIIKERLDELQRSVSKEHEHAALLETVLSKAPIGFALIDKNFRYLRVNDFLAEINGISAQEHLGKTVRELFPDFADVAEKIIIQVIKTNQPVLNVEFAGETPAQPGKTRHWLESFYPVQGRNGQLIGIGAIVNEITRRKEAEDRMLYQAFHDPLTNLPNRKHFDEYLMKSLHRSKKAGNKFAVLFVDTDRLKDINDTLGHYIGDEILKEITARLRSAIDRKEFLARWGGDEFVVLVCDVETVAGIAKLAQKLLDAIESPMRIDNHTLHITASIGIAVFPTDGEDSHTLLKNADVAMYRAKEAGKNRYALYNLRMNSNAPQRLVLENDLRQAQKKGEFHLYYQPIFNIKTQRIVAVEALLRWKHPRHGLILPGKFIPVAEDIGLISSLGKWVLKTACEHLKEFHNSGLLLNLSVNASARQFTEPTLIDDVFSVLEEVEIEPRFLEIEVTESVAMENLDRTRHVLRELQENGVSITIDDFGTGYSSLNYLKRFPIHKLKIDKSFVNHCLTDEQDTSIIKAIISMAKSLNLKVVAEGVDTEMQLNLLASLGCDEVQGFFISRPLTPAGLKDFLETNMMIPHNAGHFS